MVEFLHLLCTKKKFFCVALTSFCVYILLKTSSLVKFVKAIFKNILTKADSQNRNFNIIMEDSINLQTKSTGSENSVSVGSWPVALRKCRTPFLKE